MWENGGGWILRDLATSQGSQEATISTIRPLLHALFGTVQMRHGWLFHHGEDYPLWYQGSSNLSTGYRHNL